MYQKPVPKTGNRKWYRFFSASFSYQLRLVSKFLVPETNMADNTVAVRYSCCNCCERKRKQKKRTIWMQPRIAHRETHGAYHPALLQELDDRSYRNFLRMDRGSLEMLLHKVALYIRRQDTTMRLRLSITPEERLAATLRYLATGE